MRGALKTLVGLAGGVLMLTLVACEAKVTDTNYEKITVGMTLGQVETILGKGERDAVTGMSISGAGVAGGSTGTPPDRYIWKDGMREISCTFKDGKVVEKNKTF